MDQIELNSWLTGDDDIMNTLVGLASYSDKPFNQNPHNSEADILDYLLRSGNTDSIFPPISTEHTQPHSFPPKQSTTTNQVTQQQSNAPTSIGTTDASFRDSVPVVVQQKDNFVTFLPLSTPTTKKQRAAPRKGRFKEPIFVTESPQSYKNKKKAAANTSNHHSSAEDNSEDKDEMSCSSKQTTSKERRQLRNKMSARNFRIRRKEYITQLEEKLADHEQTISDLQKENERLHQVNQDIIKQFLVAPITPPSSSSGDELLSGSSTSGCSEGHNSPDALPPTYQFQLNDLYDFNLFDQQAQQAHQQMNASSNLFYLNHATMPAWDMSQVLGEKAKSISSKDYQREISRELISNYPLLAPALMSIVLRHTLSLEYVTALAKEFSANMNVNIVSQGQATSKRTTEEDQGTLCGVDIDDLKSSFNSLKIEDKQESEKEIMARKSELELTKKMLTKYFCFYVMYRARGLSHQEVMDKCMPCLTSDNPNCGSGKKKSKAKSTLHTYCRVAGNLLRHPHLMTRVSDVLKKEIDFTQNKHTSLVQSHYKSLFRSTHKKPRITN